MWVKMRQLPCDFDQFWDSLAAAIAPHFRNICENPWVRPKDRRTLISQKVANYTI